MLSWFGNRDCNRSYSGNQREKKKKGKQQEEKKSSSFVVNNILSSNLLVSQFYIFVKHSATGEEYKDID